MSPGDPRVRRFIRRSMIARIATVSPRGTPQIMPLWFAYHRGRIYMNNNSTSPTVRNIQAGSPVVVLFDADRGDQHGRCLRVRGTARYVVDRRLLLQMGVRIWAKHYLSLAAMRTVARHVRRLPAMRRYYAERGSGGGVIEVTPAEADLVDHPVPGWH